MKLNLCCGFLILLCACGDEPEAMAESQATQTTPMKAVADGDPRADASAMTAAQAGRGAMSQDASGSTASQQPGGASMQPNDGDAGTDAPAMSTTQAPPTGQPGSATMDPAQSPAEVISLEVQADREHQYDDGTNWLCLPGTKDELCTTDLDTTIVMADGTTTLEPHLVAEDPKFDCFYVYPTVSNDRGSNSDLTANQEEIDVVRAQAARYTRECRLFAPLYRQVTLGALNTGGITDEARNMGYLDVVAAFNRYLTEYNQGRGFVLIGHSQGSGVLRRLIAEEIDGRQELRQRFIAAHLLGTSLAVPEGKDVGGAFQNVPVCRADDQFGCVIAYATFRADSPPPSNSRFGKASDGRAACANPAALGGGKGILTPYFFTDSQDAFARGQGEAITTPFIKMPEFLEAECVDRGEFTYLALTVLSDRADPRADDISGDITADWGLHLVDVHIAMGTLVDLAASEYAAFATQP